jgi:hypothetical protein
MEEMAIGEPKRDQGNFMITGSLFDLARAREANCVRFHRRLSANEQISS